MEDNQRLDVVVRFHNPSRLRELERAIFSVLTQTYRPLHIVLALQRFSEPDVELVRKALRLPLRIHGAPEVTILNWMEEEPPDGRSALLNHAILHTRGRYIAFLDYDDLIYPEAYELLIGRLLSGDAAIAFGGIYTSEIDVFEDFLQVRRKVYLFIGTNLLDLFEGNFCPIHSFVVDRSRIAPQQLFFDPLLSRAEDYDFLIRICAQYRSDFSLSKTYIGTYYVKNDGSNTILTESSSTPHLLSDWLDAESFIEGRRRITPVSADVQRMLGLPSVTPGLTVRRLLEQHGDVTSPAAAATSTAPTSVATSSVPMFVEPGHYYSPIPNPVALRTSSFERRRAEDKLIGLNMDFDAMELTFDKLVHHMEGLNFPHAQAPDYRYYVDNDMYGIGDALILASMIRLLRPSRIIEVGSGFSSAVVLDTLDRTPGLLTKCTFIEPYPHRLHHVLRPADHDRTTILETDVQEVALDTFAALDSGDILFLDTTHVSKAGSDVNHELFDVLPRLRSGVVIHFHDIFAHFEYPDHWIFNENRAWNEQYVLRAFLMYNDAFEILYANHAFASARHAIVQWRYPQILDNCGGGLWLRKR